MCTKGRDVFISRWWRDITRNSSFKTNNSNHLSQSCTMLQVFLHLTVSVYDSLYNLHCKQCKITSSSYILLSTIFIVARVQPKMSKGITDLLLLNASCFFFPRLSRWTNPNFDNQGTFEMCPFKKWYCYLLLLTPVSYRHRTN